MKIDPTPYIEEAKRDAQKRGNLSLISPSSITDEDWATANSLIRKRGPLSEAEMLVFRYEHDSFALSHFLDLFFECERLYCIINNMAKLEVEKGTP